MTSSDLFSARLRLALGRANLSPASLGAAVGVDKSVVSRWVTGKVRPTQHNLTRIAAVLAARLPGFSALTFDLPDAGFLEFLDPKSNRADPGALAQSLPIPFDLLTSARKETERRGMEYVGTYTLYYWAFGRPGQFARMALMLRIDNGLIEARYGAEGYSFCGWALLLLNRMYLIMAEERFEAMTFLVLNAGQQPSATFITGILTGPAEGLLVPTSGAVVLVRSGDVTADRSADLARVEQASRCSALVDENQVPEAAREVLRRAAATRNGPLMQVPFSNGDGFDTE
ncbi:MAG TPA: helix-turn-helix transcriptional regulator [Tabrizicola sp.]|nr:helix-turn-helix transcriptional regulator [Tabrizicola sp.]